MQSQLKQLLDTINFDENLYSAFENCELTSVEFSNENQKYRFSLKTPYLLDIRLYERFLSVLNTSMFSGTVCFNVVNNPRSDQVRQYYNYYLKQVYSTGILLESFLQIPFGYEDNQITLITKIDTIYSALHPLIPEIEKRLNDIGLDIKVELLIKDEKSSDFFSTILENDVRKIDEISRSSSVPNQTPIFLKPENRDFYKKEYRSVTIAEIEPGDTHIEITGKIFFVDIRITRNNTKRYSIYLTDGDRSILMKCRETKNFSSDFLDSLVTGKRITVRGQIDTDDYYRDPYLTPHNISVLPDSTPKMDTAEEKRVELHAHTKMSNMDGVVSATDLIKQAIRWGHKAIAITDHGCVQSFPEAQQAAQDDIKVIYGMEGYCCNNKKIPAYNSSHILLQDQTYVVFDLETTGLSNRYDRIIEIGFVKYKNGVILDTFQSFINPLMMIDQRITNLTNITNDMVIGAPTIDQLIPKIKDYIKDAVLVAHNASFDVGFLNACFKENGYGTIDNPVIDTLDLSHCIFRGLKNYKLGTICKHCNIIYDEDDAHRADYDATVLANLWGAMLNSLHDQNIYYHDELNSLTPEDSYKSERPYHTTFLAKNPTGLKNLFKLVSISNIEYIASQPMITRDVISKHREGLLVGTSCFNGEIFDIASTKSYEELKKAIEFYDLVEIQPLENYMWLVKVEKMLSKERLIDTLKDIVRAGKEMGKIVVATGDLHYLNEEDKIFRDVYICAKAVGKRFHALRDEKHQVHESPIQHFRTTQEMIDGISFLEDYELQKELVITNSNKIADMCEVLHPMKSDTYSPKLDYVDANQEIIDITHKNAHELYGETLPKIVEERLENELEKIIGGNFGVIYYLAYRLVKKSNDDGFLVGSRGSVGSSFVASLCGITEVNPLPPHYLCPHCHHSEFFTDGSVRSGYDLDDKVCPECGNLMHGNGQNIPFETFLGLKGGKTKVPDIDLNFARNYQAIAHEYTKELCGEKNVFRAGTIGTVAEKTAFGHVRNYFEVNGITDYKEADIRRLAVGCVDVKRTTGQHPAGIVVLPNEYEIEDFTPVQYPAESPDSVWKTTHFDFNSMHDELLKLDILGHLDPMALKMLRDLTGIDPKTIPMNDPDVLGLFTGLNTLKLQPYEVLNDIGSSGVPEFGTPFVKGVLMQAKPLKFSDLVQISGLTHGTDVWNDNAQSLIKDGTCTLTEVIGCRDDIMTDLIRYGVESTDAFNIMEFVRKGNPTKKPKDWPALVDIMHLAHVPQWYIDSCSKIKYMFPKAHAVAYVVMALRVAWFKIHYPLEYYAAYFSVRCDKFDIEAMVAGHDKIQDKLVEVRKLLSDKNEEVSKTAELLHETLELSLEMTARGYKFENISIEKSDAVNFIVDHENKSLIPPFIVLDGLGEAVAKSIVEARNNKMFVSKEDLINNTQINKTQLENLDRLGCLKSLSKGNQINFDFDFED